MKSEEIKVGNHYVIKLRAKTLGVVIVSREGERNHSWYGINVATDRQVYIRSARRFIKEASAREIEQAKGKLPIIRIPETPPLGKGLYSDLANAQMDVQTVYMQMSRFVLELATRKRPASDSTLQVVAGIHRELSLRLLGHFNTILTVCNAPADPPKAQLIGTIPVIIGSVDKSVPGYKMDRPYPIGPCYSTNEWEALEAGWKDGQAQRDLEEEEMSKWDD